MVMLKILQARLQQYENGELSDVQCGFKKGRGTRDQIANSQWIIKKAREFKKNIYLCFIDYANAFLWITTNCGKLLKRWEFQTTLPASWEPCMQVKRQQWGPYMEQLTGITLRKEYSKAVHCHSVYLTSMQSTSCKMLGWMSYKLESRLPGEISTTSVCRWYHYDTTVMAESEKELKSLLMKVQEGSEKVDLNLNIKKKKNKHKDHSIQCQHFIANIRGRDGSSDRFPLLVLQNHCRWWLQPWN